MELGSRTKRINSNKLLPPLTQNIWSYLPLDRNKLKVLSMATLTPCSKLFSMRAPISSKSEILGDPSSGMDNTESNPLFGHPS
jgi:hypothetical protein